MRCDGIYEELGVYGGWDLLWPRGDRGVGMSSPTHRLGSSALSTPSPVSSGVAIGVMSDLPSLATPLKRIMLVLCASSFASSLLLLAEVLLPDEIMHLRQIVALACACAVLISDSC
jgi:hypothetical protein